MLGLGPIGLCRSLGKLQAIDRIGIVGEVPWQIVDPVVDFDVALIFQEPDEAPDPCCLVSLVAVSYTHLRAHETVLDLVCRFLLEKKN